MKKSNLINYISLIDSNINKKYGLTIEYFEGHYNYLEKMWHHIELNEKINRLEDILVNTLISYNFGQLKKDSTETFITITSNYVRYVGKLKSQKAYESMINDSIANINTDDELS